jgi:His/Glu/Gln/Arg/opine family amino acid ABC transporter permease subunit
MTCWETVQAYAFRALGYGERLLPTTDITFCQQATLIGSGMIWNVYFGLISLVTGFCLAILVALGKNHRSRWIRKPSEWFVFIFRGSPLFIQFFFGYFTFLSLKQSFPIFDPLTSAFLGAAVVLFLNTAAYSAEIFHGALQSIPKGDVEAADAYGMSGWPRFRRVIWPTMLRLGWPAYTNEAIFLFHSTTLVFFSGFPATRQMGDALYYASYFADKTFNPFVPYPILAAYFILLTLVIIGVFGLVNRRLNRHLPQMRRTPLRFKPQIIR